MQIPLGSLYVLRLRPVVLLVMTVMVIVCIKLGLWQWHKAEQKQAIADALLRGQTQTELLDVQRLQQPPYIAQMHMHSVELTGHYLPQYTFFLDNQVENGQAGFHVLTPMLLSDGKTLLLVNRGWVAGYADHQRVPVVMTSPDAQTIKGWFWQQQKTGFRLDQAGEAWQPVQQVIDFAYLRKQWQHTLPSVVLKLDSAVAQDGFVRNWTLPEGQIEKNLSYAYQWFGFALASVLIGVYQMLEKRE